MAPRTKRSPKAVAEFPQNADSNNKGIHFRGLESLAIPSYCFDLTSTIGKTSLHLSHATSRPSARVRLGIPIARVEAEQYNHTDDYGLSDNGL